MQGPVSGLAVVAVFWSVLFLADVALKNSKYGAHYHAVLQNCGLTIMLAHFRWRTTQFNRLFTKLGRFKPKLLRAWFNCGVLFGGIAMISSLVILSMMLYKSFKEEKPEQVLTPVMPGMNLPWNQIVYYVVTLIVAGAFHEVGHAIAAVREQVRVQSFGLFVLAVYPGAFVELHTDQLTVVAPMRQLRIYCAGVWHNFVLAVTAGLLYLSLPYLLLLMYHSNNGVAVTWIHKASSISAELPIGDEITRINACAVNNISDWHSCLSGVVTSRRVGYCQAFGRVKTQNTSSKYVFERSGEPDCCNETGSYRFCFVYDTKNIHSRHRTIPGSQEHACLPARQTMSLKTCYRNTDCGRDMLCLKPLTSNHTHVLKIGHRKGQDVLFVGHPSELKLTIMLSNYAPKYFFCPVNMPTYLYSISIYMLSISAALSILNMVPCYSMDGHFALIAFVEVLLPRFVPNRASRNLLIYCFLFSGTALLIVNILLALFGLAVT